MLNKIADSDAVGGYRTLADIPRAYHGIAFVKNFIYVIGGFDGIHYFNTVRRFNVISYEWVEVLFFIISCFSKVKLKISRIPFKKFYIHFSTTLYLIKFIVYEKILHKVLSTLWS